MNENWDITPNPGNQNDHRPLLEKWLRTLLLVQTVGIVITVVNAIPVASTVTQWLSLLISAAAVVVCFNLAPANQRYRKTAIFRCVTLAGTFLALFDISALTLITSVCSIIAMYQEYSAHSEVTAAAPGLSRKWHSLFYLQLVVGIVTGLASATGVVIAALAGADADTIVSVTLLAVIGATVVLQIIYLTYLKKTLELFRE